MSDQLTVKLGLILLVASVVAIVSRRMRLPYSVGLVAAGILLAIAPTNIGMPISPDAIFTVLLPPLIFEAALQIRWAPFRRDLPLILLLAFVGVAVAAALVAAGMHALAGWSWLGAATFGVLIAATDPVSVIATFKEMKAEPRLSRKRCCISTLRRARKIGPPVVLEEGRQCDGSGVGIRERSYDQSYEHGQ
jgi:monovalent cation:H+ antiporter, CPA1 family